MGTRGTCGDCDKFFSPEISANSSTLEVNEAARETDSSLDLESGLASYAIEPGTDLPFHPTDQPHGMKNYDLGCLSSEQQRALNRAKMTQRKENEIYLKAHPEIRALIAILLRHVLQRQPTSDVHEVIGEYFWQPRELIGLEVIRYLSRSEDCPIETIERLRRVIAEGSESEASSSSREER